MSNKIPLEVYQEVAKLNQRNLLQAIAEGDNKLMWQSMNRLTHALEQVHNYKQEGEGK